MLGLHLGDADFNKIAMNDAYPPPVMLVCIVG